MDTKSVGEAFEKIRGVQGELRIWLDFALLEYMEKYDKDCYDGRIAASANIIALKYLKQTVLENIGDSEECALAVGIFASGYIDGRIMTAVEGRKRPRKGLGYCV
ncbi:MAG: hypothetical protein NT016_01125 [Candidatus Aenigmarchaeota archaeon]|nr:hypothetical protein [Candidatus Aenigmarchaeota archaeon]